MLRLTIDHDSDVNAPWLDSDGMWRVIMSDEVVTVTDDFRHKLLVGLAFPLSKYEHGGVLWSIVGSGPQCRWDTVVNAGFLVWDHKPEEMGAKSFEDRKKDAEGFLGVFNSWANGEWYCYKLERVSACDHCGSWVTEELGACSGFIGGDHLFDALQEVMEEYVGEEYEFAGECAYLGDYRLLGKVK